MAGCNCLGPLASVLPFLLNLGRKGVLKNYSVLCLKKMPQEVPNPHIERNRTRGLSCDIDRSGGGLWAGVARGGENSQAWKSGDLGSKSGVVTLSLSIGKKSGAESLTEPSWIFLSQVPGPISQAAGPQVPGEKGKNMS